jgi:hypothetical protein
MLAVQMPNSHRLEVAPALVAATFKDADRELEARVAEWLAQDPEPLPIVRLMVLDRPSDPPIGIRELAAGTGSNVQTSAARPGSKRLRRTHASSGLGSSTASAFLGVEATRPSSSGRV